MNLRRDAHLSCRVPEYLQAREILVCRSMAELDFSPAGKPALVLSMVDAHVAAFINTERSFTFQLDTEDGGHYLLQATSKVEMNKWVKVINDTSHSYAQRRLTFTGEAPQLQISDQVPARSKTRSRDPKAVFGVELEFLLRREAEDGEIAPGVVPQVFEMLLREVESRGLTEHGICEFSLYARL